MWWTIILAIAAVIAGYFFMKKYDFIDAFLFGKNDPNYVPFGKNFLLASAAVGAAYALVGVILNESNVGDSVMTIAIVVAGVAFVTIFGFMVWQIVKKITDVKTRVWKSLFALVAVLFSAVIGVMAMFLVILAVMLYILWKIIDIFFLGGGVSTNKKGKKEVTIEDENGNSIRCVEEKDGIVRARNGKRYERIDDLITGKGNKYREI